MKEEKVKEVKQEEFDKFVKKILNFDPREKKEEEINKQKESSSENEVE